MRYSFHVENCMGRFTAAPLLTLLITAVTLATTIHVPDDQLTIQAGLNTAVEGDTVLVASGTYYENIVWPAVNGIKLIGSSEDDCIVDGDSLDSVIRFNWELGGIIDATTLISNFTIQNGLANGNTPDNRGGGIRCTFASPSLYNLMITDNYATDRGGGLYCETNSSASLLNVTVAGNIADQGGGIYCNSSSPSLTNVTVIGNTTTQGGGVYTSLISIPNLATVSITSNSADQGGGIYCHYSNPTLSGVMISDNSAIYGGGIYCCGSSPGIENVTITNNSAYENGSGIYCDDYSSLSFSAENRCNVYSNTVHSNRGYGADIFSFECDVIDVIVDTFTVIIPTDYHASPIDNFTFDIFNSFQDDLVNADV
ncbi:MAG: hypothetical protein ISR91_02810 [Candidatus Delongbacteria bacterium]|nr:hypothetical protein [Candidatus Delongbacteria bacterium]